MLLKIQVFWDVVLCEWVNSYEHLEKSKCLHLQNACNYLAFHTVSITQNWTYLVELLYRPHFGNINCSLPESILNFCSLKWNQIHQAVLKMSTQWMANRGSWYRRWMWWKSWSKCDHWRLKLKELTKELWNCPPHSAGLNTINCLVTTPGWPTVGFNIRSRVTDTVTLCYRNV